MGLAGIGRRTSMPKDRRQWVISESILMALIEHGVLTKAQLIDAIDTAILAKRQMVQEGQDVEVSRIAAGLLTALQTSLASFTKA